MSPKPLWADESPDVTVRDAWRPLVELSPPDKDYGPQFAVRCDKCGQFVLGQSGGAGQLENIILTRYSPAGKYLDKMMIPKGGHVRDLGFTADHEVSTWVHGVYVALPWRPGKVWSVAEALKQRAAAPPPSRAAAGPYPAWIQGEVYDRETGTWLRLHGVPFKKDGPSTNPRGKKNPYVPAYIDHIRNGKVEKEDVSHLGRIGMKRGNDPIGGRLEPEGIALTKVDGLKCVIVGISVYPVHHNRLQLYIRKF